MFRKFLTSFAFLTAFAGLSIHYGGSFVSAQQPKSSSPPTAKAKTQATTEAIGGGKLIQKIVARRLAAQEVAKSESIGFRAALRLIDRIDAKASPEELAAASGLTAADHRDGLFSEAAAKAIVVKSGVKIPDKVSTMAIGDGEFLKWLFSPDGIAAFEEWVKAIVRMIAILAPLFAWADPPTTLHDTVFCLLGHGPAGSSWWYAIVDVWRSSLNC